MAQQKGGLLFLPSSQEGKQGKAETQMLHFPKVQRPVEKKRAKKYRDEFAFIHVGLFTGSSTLRERFKTRITEKKRKVNAPDYSLTETHFSD